MAFEVLGTVCGREKGGKCVKAQACHRESREREETEEKSKERRDPRGVNRDTEQFGLESGIVL